MTALRTRLDRLERLIDSRHEDTEPRVVIIRGFEGELPPEEYVEQKRAEARAAGQLLTVIIWPEPPLGAEESS